MTQKMLSPDRNGHQANVLDHALEFVELVSNRTPEEYADLLASGRFDQGLQFQRGFNHGKLYVYAEFRVFRREFHARFPDASAASCINAFSGLFLKNDISMSNLVEFAEGGEDRMQLEENSPAIGTSVTKGEPGSSEGRSEPSSD